MKTILSKTHRRFRNLSWFNAPFLLLIIGGIAALSYFVVPSLSPLSYEVEGTVAAPLLPLVKHLETPEPLRAIYMTQCVVGTSSLREGLVKLIEETELNAVVIDVKDYSGTIGIPTQNPLLKPAALKSCGAVDMRAFLETLEQKGIYRIARITVFQDPFYTASHPELAVHKKSASTTPWRDHKGLSFIDVGARPFWQYIAELGKETYDIGFDELNFDYIRFPSDGNMADTYYTWSGNRPKAEVLEDFFSYLHHELSGTGAKLSADLFGMTTTNTDDLNIGQVLERALPYFDYIAPMVYPSHYPKGFNGWQNPNNYPHDVVYYSMSRAVLRAVSTTTPVHINAGILVSTTTAPHLYSKDYYSPLKLRPWLQDFDYGGNYDIAEVKAQIQAIYDSGLTSWMLWSPSNKYTRGALAP